MMARLYHSILKIFISSVKRIELPETWMDLKQLNAAAGERKLESRPPLWFEVNNGCDAGMTKFGTDTPAEPHAFLLSLG
jgi:hypothetical protein